MRLQAARRRGCRWRGSETRQIGDWVACQRLQGPPCCRMATEAHEAGRGLQLTERPLPIVVWRLIIAGNDCRQRFGRRIWHSGRAPVEQFWRAQELIYHQNTATTDRQ